MDCHEVRISLGVYVLGAIDPAERAQVDSHLATCRDCRDELAGLAGLPALLARVSAEEAAALADPGPGGPGQAGPGPVMTEPAPELLATVLDLTAARRRRRRHLQAALGTAAAAVVAVGVFAGVQAGSSPSPQPGPAAAGGQFAGNPGGAWAKAAGTLDDMTATVAYRPMGWGTQLDVKVTGIPEGTTCELWVTDAAGRRTLAGSWMTDNDEGKVWYPGSAGTPAKSVRSFEVTVGKGKTIEARA